MDLTGDGFEEAVWLDAQGIEDSGSGWWSSVVIYTMLPSDPAPRLLQTIGWQEGDSSNGQLGLVRVDRDSVVVSRPIFGDDDPNCCPSSARIEVWRWNGRQFIEDVGRRRIEQIDEDTYRLQE